jgi:hypothetical protein
LLSLDAEDYRDLKRQAAAQRLLPATMAARIIGDWLARRAADEGAPGNAHAVRALLDWLAPYIDEARDRGAWPENATAAFFELIEKEALDLYEAAETEIGRRTLNQAIGRMIRTRLEAEVVRRAGRPLAARVPAGRTSLIKTVTLLRPAVSESHTLNKAEES